MQTSQRRTIKERGAALLLFTLMLALVVLPMVGLAIDGGITYMAQSRLLSAADAASLAGGRSLNVGLDLASQKVYAETMAKNYFNANFPPGLLNTKDVAVTATAAESGDHTRTVTVSAKATVNLYFMPILNQPTSTVTSYAQTSRRDVNVMIVLDRSGSMSGVCGTLIGNAQSFVDKFSNGRDMVGLITFMASANLDYQSTREFKTQNPTLHDKLSELKCGANTASADALSLARAEVKKANLPGALNVVVFFTDGQPTVYSSAATIPSVGSTGFPVKDGSACAGGPPQIVPGFIYANGSTPAGIYNPGSVAIDVTATSKVITANCNYTRTGSITNDIAYLPDVDSHGNSASASGYQTVTRAIMSDGLSHITVTGANVDSAATNAADYAANLIRNDGTMVYTIGLGSNGGVDNTLLRRMANDPASNIYNPSQPIGHYYYAPTPAQLSSAFDAIASQILRLAK